MFPVFSIQRVKELIEGAGKQREVWEVFVPEASGFDETPDTFNEIKVGGIGWKVKELHVERVCHFHNQSASLVTGIVHHQRNLLSGIRGTDFLQKFADYFRINRSGCPNAHEIMVACLNGAENAVTLPPTSTWHKDPGEGPNHAQKGTQYEVGGINEKNSTLTLLRLFQARQELFVEKIKLRLGVASSRNGSCFAEFQAEPQNDPSA